MATASNGRATCESCGAGVNVRKRSFQPETNEELQNASQEAGQYVNKSSGVSEPNTHQGGSFATFSVTVGKLELEQMVTQMTFTWSEAQRLKALVDSRTMEEPPSSLLRVEASTSQPQVVH